MRGPRTALTIPPGAAPTKVQIAEKANPAKLRSRKEIETERLILRRILSA